MTSDGETVRGAVRFHSCSRKDEGVAFTRVRTSDTEMLVPAAESDHDLVAPSPIPSLETGMIGGGMAVPHISRAE